MSTLRCARNPDIPDVKYEAGAEIFHHLNSKREATRTSVIL